MFSFEIDWLGLALPFAYLTILTGSLMTFSSVYRKRKAAQSANLEPWFGPHLQRNIYYTLQDMQPEKGQDKPKIPPNVLKAALLRRAVEDIGRLMQVRTAKQALSTLLQKGNVGDDLWQRFQRAEKEMESELRDVVMEANALAPNWGQFIFQSANEMSNNERFKKRMDEIQGKLASEKAWWEKRRATIENEFMKELEDEAADKSSSAGKTPSEDDAVLVDSSGPSVPTSSTSPAASKTPAGTPSGKKKKGKK